MALRAHCVALSLILVWATVASDAQSQTVLFGAEGGAQDAAARSEDMSDHQWYHHRKLAAADGQHKEQHPAGPVCIIGAGASGLASALRLTQKGYKDIVIFERNAIAGGKAVTMKVEPNDHPLYIGAIIGVEESYPKIVELLKSYNIPYQPIKRDEYSLSTEGGLIIPLANLPVNRTAIAAAFAKYSALYMGAKQYLVPGYLKGLPQELQQSYESWVHANGLEALMPVLQLLGGRPDTCGKGTWPDSI